MAGRSTRGHALTHLFSAESTRSSAAEQAGRRERRWRSDTDKTSPLLVLGSEKALGKMGYGIGIGVRTRTRTIIIHITTTPSCDESNDLESGWRRCNHSSSKGEGGIAAVQAVWW
jgi:hypothetical protein